MSSDGQARYRYARGVLSDTAFIALGRYSQLFVTLLTVPLIARALGVEKTGQLGVAMASTFLGSIVVDWGLTQVLASRLSRGALDEHIPGAYRRLKSLLLTGLAALLIVSLAIAPDNLVTLVFLGAVAGGVASLGDDWVYIARGQFRRLAAIQLIGRVLYLLLIPWLIWLVPQAWLPILVLLLTNSVTTFFTRRCHDLAHGNPRKIAGLFRDGVTITASKLLTSSYGTASTIVYASVVSDRLLGLFSAADRVVRAGQSGLDAFALALLPQFARADKARPTQLRRRVLRLASVAGAAGLVAATILWVISPTLVPLIFGEAFVEAIPFFQVQAFILPATAVTSALSTMVLYVREDRAGILAMSVLGLGISVAGLGLIITADFTLRLSVAVVITEYCVALWAFGRSIQLANRDLKA